MPLYFEGGTDLPYGESPLRPEIAKTGVPILDPSIEVYDGVVRQYPTSGRCFGPNGQTGGECLSLALRVYKDLYPKHPARAAEWQDGACLGHEDGAVQCEVQQRRIAVQ